MPHQKEETLKTPTTQEPQQVATPHQEDNTLPIIAMVLGLVSLTGPGLILGIPAIVLASISIKKKRGNQGMSIAGLVSGIISTLVSLFFIVFIVFVIIANLSNPANPIHHPGQREPLQQQNNSRYDTQSY